MDKVPYVVSTSDVACPQCKTQVADGTPCACGYIWWLATVDHPWRHRPVLIGKQEEP